MHVNASSLHLLCGVVSLIDVGAWLAVTETVPYNPVSVKHTNTYSCWEHIFVTIRFTCITEAQQKHNGSTMEGNRWLIKDPRLSTQLVLVQSPLFTRNSLKHSYCRHCHILILSPGTREQEQSYAISSDSQSRMECSALTTDRTSLPSSSTGRESQNEGLFERDDKSEHNGRTFVRWGDLMNKLRFAPRHGTPGCHAPRRYFLVTREGITAPWERQLHADWPGCSRLEFVNASGYRKQHGSSTEAERKDHT